MYLFYTICCLMPFTGCPWKGYSFFFLNMWELCVWFICKTFWQVMFSHKPCQWWFTSLSRTASVFACFSHDVFSPTFQCLTEIFCSPTGRRFVYAAMSSTCWCRFVSQSRTNSPRWSGPLPSLNTWKKPTETPSKRSVLFHSLVCFFFPK